MDSPMSDDANKQIILVPSKSQEEQGSTSMDQEESGENEVPADEMLAPPGFENYQLAIVDHDHDRDYGCRYCDKRFSNKQALGGHQNAHKVERSMEIRNDHEASIDFFAAAAAAAPAPAPFLHSYPPPPRPSDFLNRSLFSWGYGGGVIPYNPQPPPEHGFNCSVYQGWSAPPSPRIPQFLPPRPHYMLPPHNINIRLPNFGPGSSGAFRNLYDHQGPPGFGPYVARPGPVNLRNVPGVSYDEYAGLDLSLKLG